MFRALRIHVGINDVTKLFPFGLSLFDTLSCRLTLFYHFAHFFLPIIYSLKLFGESVLDMYAFANAQTHRPPISIL